MKILYITQYFPPEIGAGAVRALNTAKYFSELGHEVQIITELPNYPDGKIPEKYRGKLVYSEKFEGIDVLRTYVRASDRNTFLKRLLFYVSFMVSSCVIALHCKKPDLTIATSPPLPVALSGYFVSKIKNTKLILDIRDLWIESAVALGQLNNKCFLYLATWLESFLYQKANGITTPVYGLCGRIRKNTPVQIFHLVNTVRLANFQCSQSSNEMKQEYGLNKKFVVLYSGNHGLAQGLEFILQSALGLERFKDILFLFVGEGVKKTQLKKQKRELKLDNVIFLGKKNHKEMPDIINMSDVCLVPLKKSDLFLDALPSKMFEYMALKKPIILSVRGEAEKLLKDANAGIVTEPEDSRELSEAILKLYKNRKLGRLFGENGYRYIRKFYSHQNQLASCEELLRSV